MLALQDSRLPLHRQEAPDLQSQRELQSHSMEAAIVQLHQQQAPVSYVCHDNRTHNQEAPKLQSHHSSQITSRPVSVASINPPTMLGKHNNKHNA